MSAEHTVALFSYGTLQLESVQVATFGRRVEGAPDAMPGFRKAVVEVTDPYVLKTSGERFHSVVVPSDEPLDTVEGAVFLITPDELAAADRYEVADYKRARTRLHSGLEAWVYVKA